MFISGRILTGSWIDDMKLIQLTRNSQQEANDAPPLYHFRQEVVLLWKTSFCLHRMRRVARTLQEQYRSVTLE